MRVFKKQIGNFEVRRQFGTYNNLLTMLEDQGCIPVDAVDRTGSAMGGCIYEVSYRGKKYIAIARLKFSGTSKKTGYPFNLYTYILFPIECKEKILNLQKYNLPKD